MATHWSVASPGMHIFPTSTSNILVISYSISKTVLEQCFVALSSTNGSHQTCVFHSPKLSWILRLAPLHIISPHPNLLPLSIVSVFATASDDGFASSFWSVFLTILELARSVGIVSLELFSLNNFIFAHLFLKSFKMRSVAWDPTVLWHFHVLREVGMEDASYILIIARRE